MSTIQIEIPLDALSRANVARALADLTLALGGHAVGAAAPAAPAPKVEKPTVVAAPVDVEAAVKADKPAKSDKPAKAAKPAKPAKPAKARPATGKTAPRPELEGLSVEARWDAYFKELPLNSQRFLDLLKEKGRLTLPEAVVQLQLDNPKAMGGLTGAMARWAPKQGVKVPYDTLQDTNGTRYWVWKGIQ
jgi:hypothetical protein